MFALLQAAFALLARQAGRILNTAFGWATSMLFGKVPKERQLYLSVIALVAVLWLVVVVGIALPSVGTFLLAFVPLPDWVEPNWVRLAMLIAAGILPAVTGGLTLLIMSPEDRPQSIGGYIKTVLRGYPYTLGLALAIVAMIFVAPLLKLRDLWKGWIQRHVPVVVEADDYFEVLENVQRILLEAGFRTKRQHASSLLRTPTRVFAWLAGSSADTLVARELQTLRASNLLVLLHPSDLVIHADEPIAARVHALLNEHLAFSKAYLSWTKQGQELEDELRKIAAQTRDRRSTAGVSRSAERLKELRDRLDRMNLEAEEWEVLFRTLLLAELLVGEQRFHESDRSRSALLPLESRGSLRQDMGSDGSHSIAEDPRLKWASIAGAAVAFGTVVWRNWRARHPAE